MSMKPKYLPTPEEIVKRTAEIRDSWSEDEEVLRSQGIIRKGRNSNLRKREPWIPPMYHISLTKSDGLVADRID